MLSLSQSAPIGVSLLIFLLAYGSQSLFHYIEPFSLEPQQAVVFNILVGCIWICYGRACLTNPGSMSVSETVDNRDPLLSTEKENDSYNRRRRWCRKCKVFKPPRAHHCKTCKRDILKMDHHCVWTCNCVSHRTFPHFIRFLFYAVASMSYLQYFFYIRAAVVWKNRNLPSYLGPSPTSLAFLFILILTNSITLFALSILLIRFVWSLCTNVTTIESWEIERHKTLLRRAKAFGGFLDGPDGIKVRIVKQEFPYDIGIWANISQGMDGGFPTWLWPFTKSPSSDSGLSFEVNGFEDPSATWPPPDPDRMSRQVRFSPPDQAFIHPEDLASNQEQMQAFRKRQDEDLKRYQVDSSFSRRRPFHQRFERTALGTELEYPTSSHAGMSFGEEAWRNSEGEGLADFGVDEEVEFYDEDNVPLAQLIQRRRAVTPHAVEIRTANKDFPLISQDPR